MSTILTPGKWMIKITSIRFVSDDSTSNLAVINERNIYLGPYKIAEIRMKDGRMCIDNDFVVEINSKESLKMSSTVISGFGNCWTAEYTIEPIRVDN